MNYVNKIALGVPLTPYDLKIGNLVWVMGRPHEILAIAMQGAELRRLNKEAGVIYSFSDIFPYHVIIGYGDEFQRQLLTDNGFTCRDEITFTKNLPVGEMVIKVEHLYDRWAIHYAGAKFYAQYVHDFQNIYYTLTNESILYKSRVPFIDAVADASM